MVTLTSTPLHKFSNPEWHSQTDKSRRSKGLVKGVVCYEVEKLVISSAPTNFEEWKASVQVQK